MNKWKKIPGFDDYEVSRKGEIRSWKNDASTPKTLSQFLCSDGYIRVNVSNHGKSFSLKTHILVARAFLGEMPCGFQVNHKNGIQHDNRLENLEYVTPRENTRHAWMLGLNESCRKNGSTNGQSKLNESQVLKIISLRKQGMSYKNLGKMFKVNPQTCSDIFNGKRWSWLTAIHEHEKMKQLTLDHARFNGSDYVPKFDDERLTGQIRRVYETMRDGKWRTLSEIESITGDPQASISAQLRHLRKKRFGAFEIDKRNRGERSHCIFEYRLNLHEKAREGK